MWMNWRICGKELRVAIVYPNWLTDSTEHFEKTYLLLVRE
jgi:hypothetical protein